MTGFKRFSALLTALLALAWLTPDYATAQLLATTGAGLGSSGAAATEAVWDTVNGSFDTLSNTNHTVTKSNTGLTMPRATGAGISANQFCEITVTGTPADFLIGWTQSAVSNTGHYLSETNQSAGYNPTASASWCNSGGCTGTGRTGISSGGTILLVLRTNGHVFIYDTANVGYNGGGTDSPITDSGGYTLGVTLPVLPAISFTTAGGTSTINCSSNTGGYVNATQVAALVAAGFTPYTGS